MRRVSQIAFYEGAVEPGAVVRADVTEIGAVLTGEAEDAGAPTT